MTSGLDIAVSTSIGTAAGGRVIAKNVEHVYWSGAESVTALAPTSLLVAPGEFVSLVGPSGSGKTTLLNILAGLLTPSRGTIEISDTRDAGESAASPAVGYMTQHDSLLPWRVAGQNVAFPLELQGVAKRERNSRAADLLSRVGLGDFAQHYPHQLSGGMRQRVSLARALVYRPPVLLLDEPFGALDSATRATLHGLLLDVCAEFDTTVLLVTHDLGEAISLSDRVLALAARPGRIKEEYRLPGRASRSTVRDLYRDAELIDIHNRLRNTIEAADGQR